MLFNNVEFYRDYNKINKAVTDATNLFGENVPYVKDRRIEGKVVIFDKHFIDGVILALTNGCMAMFNDTEAALFEDFLRSQDNYSFRDITYDNDDILVALDKWLLNLTLELDNPVINSCIK